MSRSPLYLTAFVLFASTCLWSQGSIGGSRGGGERGGGLGAAPGSMGGGGTRGSAAAASRTATGSARGSVARSSAPGRTAAGAAQATTARRARASSQSSVAAGGIGTAGARGGSIVEIVPGSNSIPPLERPGSLAAADARRDSAIFDFQRGRGGFQRRGGAFYALPVVVVPYAYGDYGNADDNPNVIVVDRDAQTSAEHVVNVEPQKVVQARPPVEPKVVEVEPGKAESGSKEEAQVEVLRGGSRLDLLEQQTIYLVALRTGVIHTSREHWLEGDTLHFVTKQGARRTAALETVDLDFTRQLNAERGLPFVLEVRPRSER